MNKKFSLRERILNKEVVIGTFYKFNSQAVVEMIGIAGFDFMIVDTEHSNYSSYDVEGLIRAAECVGLSSVIRVREAIAEDVLHALDSGADGVQIPSITDVETAEKVCRSSKYYPQGNRGFTTSHRAAMYGAWKNDEKYTDYSNKRSLVIAHVENLEMVEKIDGLLDIPQLDVVFVGPGDLSQAMGKPGQMNDPEVVALIEKIFVKVLERGKAEGIYCGTPADIKKYVGLGATYIAYGSDMTALSASLAGLVKSAREVL